MIGLGKKSKKTSNTNINKTAAKKVETKKAAAKKPEPRKRITIEDVDAMKPRPGFENLVAELYRAKGYEAYVTPEHDKGVDVVAKKGKDVYTIQVKHSKDGNYSIDVSAIQEVVAGMAVYKCNRSIAVTNQFFSKTAQQVALANKTQLIDRGTLIKELASYNRKVTKS